MSAKILVFSGSIRQGSLNQKLADAAATFARKAGLDVVPISLKDFPLPVYNADDEARGLPEKLGALREAFISSAGWILSSPEYNASLSPLLKNTIDWLSRPFNGDASLKCFEGKCALLLSASPGAFGGIRALPQVRALYSQLGTLVVPASLSLPKAHEAFDGGNLKDPKIGQALEGAVAKFARVVQSLQG